MPRPLATSAHNMLIVAFGISWSHCFWRANNTFEYNVALTSDVTLVRIIFEFFFSLARATAKNVFAGNGPAFCQLIIFLWMSGHQKKKIIIADLGQCWYTFFMATKIKIICFLIVCQQLVSVKNEFNRFPLDLKMEIVAAATASHQNHYHYHLPCLIRHLRAFVRCEVICINK